MEASNLTFGVEIECGIPSEHFSPFSGGSYHRGARIALPEFRGWKSENDGSVHVSGYCGKEIVSPVMSGEKGLRKIMTAVTYMENHGFTCNSTTGLHVNIGLPGGRPFTMGELQSLRGWFFRLEEGLYSLMGINAETRKRSGYAVPAVNWNGSYSWNQNKYQSLNFNHSQESGGKARVEFRLFEGRINADYVVDSVLLSAGVVSFALSTAVVPLREQMNPVDAVEAISRRILGKFDSVSGRYPHSIVPDANGSDTLADLRERTAARTAALMPTV